MGINFHKDKGFTIYECNNCNSIIFDDDRIACYRCGKKGMENFTPFTHNG